MQHANLVIPGVDNDSKSDLLSLMNGFQSLTADSSSYVRDIQTEHNNLMIMRALAARLERRSIHAETSPEASNYDSGLLTRVFYFFILSYGSLQRAVGSYLFGSTLFLLIPHINSIVLMTLSSLFVVLDSLFFYAFDVSFLKSAINIEDKPTEIGLLNQIYVEQRQAVKAINRALSHVTSLQFDSSDRQAYSNCKNIFNQHLLEKLKRMEEPELSWQMLCLEYAVIAFGAFSSITDSYFVFSLLHLSFFSPLGAMLAIGFILSGLALYYVMGVKSLNKFINPDLESFQTLKGKLSKFKAEFIPDGDQCTGLPTPLGRQRAYTC